MDGRIPIENNVNVGKAERWISAAAGGALLYYGLRRRSWLGSLLALGGGNLLLRGALGKSLIYRALGVSTAMAGKAGADIHVEKSIIIDRPPEDIYRFWRNFENLPRIMGHVKAVRVIDDRTSHWVAKGPAGMEVEWDAELTQDQENRRVAWRSLEGSDVKTEGAVSFEYAPDGRGTEVRVSLDYLPPAGKAGAAMAKLFGQEPSQQIEEDLNRFKSLLESGEIMAGQMARG
jgi:uncharacterized membrane protein